MGLTDFQVQEIGLAAAVHNWTGMNAEWG